MKIPGVVPLLIALVALSLVFSVLERIGSALPRVSSVCGPTHTGSDSAGIGWTPSVSSASHSQVPRASRVVAVTIACTLAAWLFAAMQPKRYHAVAIAAITPVADGLTSTDVLRSVDTL